MHYILRILFSFAVLSPIPAFASQYYKLIIRNESYKSVTVYPVAGRCMYKWDVPPSGTTILKNDSVMVEIEDKGTIGECKKTDIGKKANWNISGEGVPEDFGFSFHRFTYQDTWYTRIEEYHNTNIIKEANCENKDLGGANYFQNCLNRGATGTPNYGVIEVVL